MRMKVLKILFLSLLFILTYLIFSFSPTATREESIRMRDNAVLKSIKNDQNYYNLLKYENFKKSKIRFNHVKEDSIVGYMFLADDLHIYNRKFKEFNASEEQIIDDLVKKVEEDLKHEK